MKNTESASIVIISWQQQFKVTGHLAGIIENIRKALLPCEYQLTGE